MSRWPLLALLLAGCGDAEGTWLFALDRAAGTGCSEDLGGQVQHEVVLYREDEAATAWIGGLGAVLTGTWTREGALSLVEAEANAGGSAYGVEAEVAGAELAGTWLELAPECTQRVPLTGWRLSDDTLAP